MDIKRTVLWVIFFMSAVMLYDNWQRAHGRQSMFFPNVTQTTGASSTDASSGASAAGGAPAALPAASTTAPDSTAPIAQAQLVKFSTDVYDGEIDTRGGTLAKLTLKKEGDGKQPDLFVTLFDHTKDHTYLARTGVTGGNFPNHNDLYTPAAGNPSALAAGQDSMKLSFESQEKGGVKVVKTYTFTRGSYVIGVDTKIDNVGTAPVTPTVYMEIVRDSTPVETPLFSHTFLGPAVYTDQKHFQKITFSDIDKNKAEYISSADNGWVAMVQHYFASAWIPQQGVKRDIYVEKIDPSLYRVGVKEQVKTIEPGQSADVSARLFAGPEEERVLEGIAPGLDLVKDYGWVTIIAKPLFWLLQKIHGYVGNWGWSIVLLTLLIKAVFFPLSAASYKSMARMKEITPRMQALRERFKSDPQKMNAALMELYKTEKVNPFGGCLPVVIQIPVFISLYWVLLASVEMRGAPWILWIHDLSQRDPFFILPVLMAGSMFLQTRLNPTPPDPVQAKMMMFMPIAFSVMFFFFPAGLVLYYVVNNVLSIAQQYYITRTIGKKKAAS
ncbi:membrane protein insertase YidC [Burkholderia gladioli]|jgi:YidC/Oxa1 family membrane protein insertase|uniref:Membrane protein insertase YidC n=2 Tax=Burkholderia gladioli TaxID=28095 RepID=A0AAP2JCH5_BURGA|nr:membrane protein insertase YidC [Burkholderia gladioli]AEA62480.1 Putative inner membrane protein translocase component YidC [Burkholderia gladioli BSR3]AJW99191.1 membrane protein insertase, YidC/Oxa1 family [Burkholderia gladioli]ASD81228.1 membrane protein insertase YidC [Burkholderia gladioli pv. gladioli]AWY53541.1 membrane protein insertase YidC [Burkholderia gladioli pv. gladioli]KAF1063598.1 Membrane protein insertase YidC [Burkholderia gladioli]